ncbi:MAG: helix-turn-helix domain-containing protein [Elusimicrobia bacterium]|nr:helix-turn-helix domain-containing protein [Elusimicrobiota bacterium]
MVETGLLSNLSWKAKALVLVLYGYASADQRKAWPKAKRLCADIGISRRHLGRAKIELAHHGLLCFAWAPRCGGGHWLWMAGERPFDFAVDTLGPEFSEYRGLLNPAQTVAEPWDKGSPNSGTNGHGQVTTFGAQTADEPPPPSGMSNSEGNSTPEQKWNNHVGPGGPTAASMMDLAKRAVQSAAEAFRHHVGTHKFRRLVESGQLGKHLILRGYSPVLVTQVLRDYEGTLLDE